MTVLPSNMTNDILPATELSNTLNIYLKLAFKCALNESIKNLLSPNEVGVISLDSLRANSITMYFIKVDYIGS